MIATMLERLTGSKRMMNHNLKSKSMWDGWSKSRAGVPVFDPWLDAYVEGLDPARTGTVLDLGCGVGADTRYLIEHGFDVLSADYSSEALKSVERSIPGSRTAYVDMNRPLPFEDGRFCLIVGDLSLHYFDEAGTKALMGEIRRVLAPGGVLLARVSSMDDVLFGAGSGRELETRYFDHGYCAQRYFTDEDVEQFFGIVGDVAHRETEMTRDEAYYSIPKALYEVKVTRR